MRTVQSIEELNIPLEYQSYISNYIDNLSAIPYISRVILFGSCARESVTRYSDIDIFITVNREISLDEEVLIVCDSRPPYSENTLPLDILVQSEEKFSQYIDTFGMVQKQVYREGVELSGSFIRRRIESARKYFNESRYPYAAT